jgi:hypothetical protein
VAALLAAVDEDLNDAIKRLAEAEEDKNSRKAWIESARKFALIHVADLIRTHLDEPAPEERAAAEVLALAPALADIGGGPGTVDEAWRDIGREAQEQRGRDGLLTIAMLAIHGALACDAKGGA